MTPLRFASHDHGPQTTDRRQTGDRSRRAEPARQSGRSALVLALAALLAACGGSEEVTNRDRLPRRNPTEAESPAPPPADGSEDGTYQPAPIREGLFTSWADYERQRGAAVADLEDAVGTPSATRAASCKTLPVGEKACGGPRGFLVYAATGDAELDIIRRAARITVLDREANEQFGLNSDCMLLTAPEVAVENGVCVAL